jgi:CHAT domain-containing protein
MLLLCLLALTTPSAFGTPAEDASASETQMAQGAAAFDRGAFAAAARHFEQAARVYRKTKAADRQVDAMLRLASALESLGQHARARETIHDAARLAEKTRDHARTLLARSSLAMLDRDEEGLLQSLAGVRELGDGNAEAVILLSLGNLYAGQSKHGAATNAFAVCASAATAANQPQLAAKALGNTAYTCVRAGWREEALRWNDAARAGIERLTPSHDQAVLHLQAGQLYRCLDMIEPARESFAKAEQVAAQIGDGLASSYALGYQGELREFEQSYREALELTRRAAFQARQVEAPDALYRWEWQLGRLHRALGDRPAAIGAYRRAIQTLQPIRNDVLLANALRDPLWSFREQIGPLFFGLADLLLQQADAANDPAASQRLLIEARDTIEWFKAAELDDYLQDDCVNVLRARTRTVERIASDTAVIYIIPLPDRTELLLGSPEGMTRWKLPVSAERLTSEVREFRRRLETRTRHDYVREAQTLYDWLILPLRPWLDLKNVRTLVFVPDGALRTIPFGALYDGKRFLIEDFAIAVTPGVELLEPRPMRRGQARLLLNGLSEARQGFPPLPHVPAELARLGEMYHTRPLLDAQFVKPALESRFAGQQFSIVHIASHGHFASEARDTFLLTYDDKLRLDDLERLIRPSQFRGKPVELLVLSACQTAAGDDRAALGLAGVAVKAGARSALATLWSVGDESTALLVAEFYSRLRADPSGSKAQALQWAQRRLMENGKYRHPCFWSPYLMIGNWL